jgi:hypothetical protein
VAYPKEFSVVLFILLFAICVYLLLSGKLTPSSFVCSIFVSALAVAVIHNLDVVQRLTLKGGTVEATADFERIRQQVYAKAEEVQQLAEQIAGMIAESVATSNRYGGSGDPDPIAQEARYRDKLNQTLTDMGTPQQRRTEILAPFAQWIPFDLRSAILQTVTELLRKKGMAGTQMNEFGARLQKLLEGQPPLKALDQAVTFLREEGVNSPRLEQEIQRYRAFLTDGKVLPGPPRE